MVHRREMDGREIVLGNQGALWGNAMTWWDHDTGSVWSQPIGRAIVGPRAGARLEPMASTLTDWAAWKDAHPNTLALDAPGGNSRFDLDDMAIVVDLGVDAAAYPVPELQAAGVVNDTVAGLEIAVVIDDQDRWAVFSRRLDDRTVNLALIEGRLVDAATGTAWDPIRGRGLEGPLADSNLDLIPGFTSFPKDFRTFFPEGRIWPG